MPKITKKQLLDISKQYNDMTRHVVNVQEFYTEKYNYVYNSFSETGSKDTYYNEAIALALLGYNTGKLNDFQIGTLLDYAGINENQLDAISQNIDGIDFVKEISENGKAVTDMAALDAHTFGTHQKYAEEDEKANKAFNDKLNSYKPKSYTYDEVFSFAKDQHDQLLKDKRNNFNNDFKLDYKNKVLFDKEFFTDFISTLGEVENTPKNQKAGDPLYKKARETMDHINTLKNVDTIDSQKQIAMDRLNCYTSLKNSFDSKSIGDFFKSPIGFIKEWWTLKNVKKEVKEAYKLTDEALDTISNIQNKSNKESNEFFEDFEMLDPNGKIITKNPSKEEIDAVGKKLNVDPSLLSAQSGLDKIKKDFDNENLNYGTEKSQYQTGRDIQAPSNDSMSLD